MNNISLEKDHYDVALLGCWWGANYGSVLNGYAVYKILKSMGLSVLLVNKHDAKPDDWEIYNTHNERFIKKYYPKEEVSPVMTFEELSQLNEYCDIFITGSDQIWNYNINMLFKKAFMMNFVEDSKKKISFGTSFGHSKYRAPEKEMTATKRLLERFEAISVREESGARICSEVFDVKAEVVIEPVFCLDKRYYTKLAQGSTIVEEEPYILTYILDPTEEKRKAIKYYGEKSKKKVLNILDGDPRFYEKNKTLLNLPNTLEQIGADDFIKLFKNADFIITDSFHGTAFSIIFNKPFLAISNIGRGAMRFTELLDKFSLLDRLAPDPTNIPQNSDLLNKIAYTEINKKIRLERERAISWLFNAINTPKEELASIIIPMPKEAKLLYDNPDFIKIRLLATLLRDYGVKHVVLSPGGRDVPLVRIFEHNSDSFVLHRVTDERSAAYYGLGIAVQTKRPVACVCTSGTAVSNYLPAVTESYYTGVPLIMITADRYEIYHDQGEDQTIPQSNVFNGVIKKAVNIPEIGGYRGEYQARRDISDCILEATHHIPGPVHINIAIGDIVMGHNVTKKYWRLLPKIYPHILRVSIDDDKSYLMKWVEVLKKTEKILLVYGQNYKPSEKQQKLIEAFAEKYNCVISTDHISNFSCKYSIKAHNMLQSISSQEFNEKLSPDILISVGGKRLMNDPLTFKIRGGLRSIRHWSISPDGRIRDFYFRLTSVLEMSQDTFFEFFSSNAGNIKNNGNFFNIWSNMVKVHHAPIIEKFNSNYVQSLFLPSIPKASLLHLGVGQSFYDCRKYSIDESVEVYCNMGTNGIDGCTSTFMGQCAVADGRLCFLLVGDLSFFYDMNSIWNKPLNERIRILLVNNNGTGLLRIHNLKGISSVHNTTAKGWVESTGFKYMTATTKEEFDIKLQEFLDPTEKKPLFFEVLCD